ncbi:MAG TPA: PAS domain S-box protein [Thermodesulfovibrionales bacterium]|nr:PAS domain S-box protein [Thermodesulfovibrionales bacterium]
MKCFAVKGPVLDSGGALKLGLAYRIVIFTVAIIFTTSIVFNIIVKERYEDDERRRIEAKVTSLARIRAADFAKLLHDNQCSAIQEEIKVDVNAVKEITDISVYDADAKLVACRDGMIGSGPVNEWVKGALAAKTTVQRWDGYVFRYFAPVTHSSGMLLPLPGESDLIGFLSMEYNAGHLRDHLARARNYFIGVAAILTLFFTMIGVFFSRRLIKPITALTEASKRIAGGDLSVSVPEKPSDEVGVLAGNFNIMVKKIRDEIEERKAAERELITTKERLESFINNTSDAVGIIDTEGTVLQVNSAFERIYGWPADEIVGKRLPIIPEDRGAEFNALIERVRGGGSATAYETVRRRKDGGIFDVSVTISPIKDVKGNIIAFAGITRDITEMKRMLEELEKSKVQLRSLSGHLQEVREEERTRIVREIHDELGQVLTALKMDLSWVGNKYNDHVSLSEKTKSMLKLIDATIRTVKRLCTELRPGVLDDLGLTAAIEWQTGEFQGHTGIACSVAFDPEDIVLDRDRSTAVFRIFQEALTNVARHAAATAVRVELKKQNSEVVLTVADNGKGITEEEMSKPQSFGLIGMRERVRSFGGTLDVTGAQSGGTKVEIHIPNAF